MMKLSQYIYGRRPNSGLQAIARTAELPFFLANWMEAPRYGSAPVRETPERIWAQRYELQGFDEGMLLSCMYPLKQTEVPCSEQEAPYIRGITPAVHHLLVTPDDVNELLSHIDDCLRFDGFQEIDQIYRLSGAFLEPIDYSPKALAPAALSPDELEACLDLAAHLWRAFVTRKEGRRGELSLRCVYLIVPAGTPETELEAQRKLVGAALNLLPPYIRRWASVTLNMEVESEAFPNGSAMYGMVRAQADSQLTGKAVVFDMEQMVWPHADDAERSYMQLRHQQAPIVTLDELMDTLPQKFDLSFHIRLQQLTYALCNGTASVQAIEEFIKNEDLQSYQDAVCSALANVVLTHAANTLDRHSLSGLWSLCSQSQSVAEKITQAPCPTEEALAVLTRNGVLTDCLKMQAQDAYFMQLVINRAGVDQRPLSEQAQLALKNWAEAQTIDDIAEHESFYYSLIHNKQIHIPDHQQLAAWKDCNFFRYMHQLPDTTDWQQILDELDHESISRALLQTISQNTCCPWTSGYELQMIQCFNRKQTLPNWSEQDCNLAAKRISSLSDQKSQLPVLLMRCIEQLGKPIEACVTLLRNTSISSMPEMLPYVAQHSQYVQAQNVMALDNLIGQPNDLLQLPALWQQISGSSQLQLAPQQWYSLQPSFTRALSTLDLNGLITIDQQLHAQQLPSDCVLTLEGAMVQHTADLLSRTDLSRKATEEINYLRDKLARMNENQLFIIGQRDQVIRMLSDIHAMPFDTATFQKVRSAMAFLSDDFRAMFANQLTYSEPNRPSFILLTSLQKNNIFDWEQALRRIANAFDLPSETPDEYAKRSPSEQYDSFCSIVFELYESGNPFAMGKLLTSADRQSLSDWLINTSPKFIKCLRKDQIRFGDLPNVVVSELNLSHR